MRKYTILLLPVIVLFFALSVNSYAESVTKPAKQKAVAKNPLPTIGNQEKLRSLLKEGDNLRRNYFNLPLMGGARKDAGAQIQRTHGEAPTGGLDDHSTTNVQVEGVDEADTVKTDGRYIYKVNNQQEIIIAKAYPAEKLAVVKTLKYKPEEFSPMEIYVDKEHLVVIGTSYYPLYDSRTEAFQNKNLASDMRILPQPMGRQTVKAIIYDITVIDNIEKIKELEIEGGYISSRKIGSSLYLIANKYIDYYYIMESQTNQNDTKKDAKGQPKAQPIPTPVYRDGKGKFISLSLKDIRYFPKATEPNYLIIAGLDLKQPQGKLKVSAYLGSGQTVYASMDNLYVTVAQSENVPKAQDNQNNAKKIAAGDVVFKTNTVIYKFGLKEGTANYLAEGKVPGNILNQFSMDEFDGNFRIATTVGDTWRTDENTSKNNLYVLDQNMKTVGKLENLAPGERIYSVRFMGKRGFIVTFKQVDPLFVIDLQNPTSPKVLGKLKIPGYSNYLHPYDENHILGFGKDTIEVAMDNPNGTKNNIALYQGMKVALFDITDVTNPMEKFKADIGDRGTDSELLYNHKVLLFSKAKNLLAFPVTVTEVKKDPAQNNGFEYGLPVFQGAYVYNIDLEKGFTLKGKITHLNEENLKSGKPEAFDWNKSIQRILYIDDNLYTLSQEMIKANSLENLKEINVIKIN